MPLKEPAIRNSSIAFLYWYKAEADACAKTGIVADGTADAEERLKRVLRNDPCMAVIRHADAVYNIAERIAEENGLDLKSRL